MPTRRHQPPRKCKTGRVARDPPPTGWQSKKLRTGIQSKIAGSSGSDGGNQHLDRPAEAALQPPQAGSTEFLADNRDQARELAAPERLSQPDNRHVGASHPQPSAAAGTKSSSSPALEEPGATTRRTVPVTVGNVSAERKRYKQMIKEFSQITIQTEQDSSVPDTERDKASRNKLNRRQDTPSTRSATQIPTAVRQEQQPAPAAATSTMRTRSANQRGAPGIQLPQSDNTQPASSATPRPNPQPASSAMQRPNPQPSSAATPRPNAQPAPNPSVTSTAPHPSGTGTISWNVNVCPACDQRTVTRLHRPAGNSPGAGAARSRVSRDPCQCNFPVLPITGLQGRMDAYFAANPVSQMTPEEVCEFFTTGTSSTNPALNALGLGKPW